MTSLGCMVYDPETGTRTYDPERNPLLIRGLTSTTYFWFNVTNRRDNSSHATVASANAIVTALNRAIGGFTLAPPEAGYGGMWGWGRVEWSSPKISITRPDGETFAAGLVGFILGNEAYCPGEPQRDGEIYKLLGYGAAEIEAVIAPCRSGRAPWLSDLVVSLALGGK